MNLVKLAFINLFFAFVFSILGVLALVAVFHILEKFYRFNYFFQKIEQKNPPSFNKKDPFPLMDKVNGMYRFNPIPHFEESLNSTGEPEYSLEHIFSPIGSRQDLFIKEGALHYIAMGDSQTFGLGVKEKEVYSNRVAQKLDGFRTYNFGFMGWGPAATYAFFEKELGDIKKYVKEEKGIMTWLYFPYLAGRDYGTTESFSYTNALLPKYEMHGQQLVLRGKFKDNFDEAYKRLLALTHLFSPWDVYKEKLFPSLVSLEKEKAQIFSAKVFKQMEKRYLEEYPQSEFYILICGLQNEDKKTNKFLKQEGLRFIDLRGRDICFKKEHFYSEKHLRPSSHQKIADFIFRDVIMKSPLYLQRP